MLQRIGRYDLSQLFDAHIIASPPANRPAAQLGGALFFGSGAAEFRNSLCIDTPDGIWRHAEELNCVAGPDDPRFPKSAPAVIDLTVVDVELRKLLTAPAHTWFPLAGGSPRHAIRLHLPPNGEGGAIPLLKKLVRNYPHTTFLIDPFWRGATSQWLPLVRLAECDNIFLTTLGLAPGAGCSWPERATVEDAFHFVSGEVGTGKLIFASGNMWSGYSAVDHLKWIDDMSSLDHAQREMVAWSNAAELFR